MDRRRYVKLASAIPLLAILGGCTDFLDEAEQASGLAPDPQVVDAEVDQGFIDGLTGSATVHVVVQNDGAEGDVRIEIVQQRADGQTVVDRTTSIVFMREDERRQESIDVEVGENAERYTVNAEPV